MVIKKLAEGTRIYLKKKKPFPLYIQPDKTLVNDTLYVAYDVRENGITVIPKGSRVIGDWVTESRPTIAAQFQLTRVYINGCGQDIKGDSEVIEATSDYNDREVCNVGHLYKQLEYRGSSNIKRRIADIGCRVKTLLDNHLNTIYLEIFTKEIPITLTQDFVAFPCLR